jgi:hypothetical protein
VQNLHFIPYLSARYQAGAVAVQEGQIAGGSSVLRLGRGGEKEEGVVGTKLGCSPRWKTDDDGRNRPGTLGGGRLESASGGGAPVVNPRWEAALRLRLVVLELLAALFSSGGDPRRRPGGEQGGGRNCRAAAATTLCSYTSRARRAG